jgi:hypothetical protein
VCEIYFLKKGRAKTGRLNKCSHFRAFLHRIGKKKRKRGERSAHKKTPTSFHQWEFQARDESKLIVFVFEDDVEKEKWSARTAYSQT